MIILPVNQARVLFVYCTHTRLFLWTALFLSVIESVITLVTRKGQERTMLSPKDEVFGIINGEDIGYFPRTIIFSTPVVDMMKAADAYWPEGHYDGEQMAKIAGAIHDTTGFNSVMLHWDHCAELEALGGTSSVGNKITDIPEPKEPAFSDIDEIRIDRNILKRGRFPEIFKAIKIVRSRYKDDIVIVPVVCGPLDVACLSVGVNKMYKMMIKDPAQAFTVLDKLSDLCILFGNEVLRCGGDMIHLSDPFCQGLTGETFKRFIIPVYKKISERIRGPVYLHICGNTSQLLQYIPDSGFFGFSFDSPPVSVEQVKNEIGKRMKLIGSVPTVTHILEGTKQDVFYNSLECIHAGVDFLAASCGFPPEAPLENIKEMQHAIDHYNNG
jgi:[methyl-Co(III) methanol-specific corrinoid protein]:coenzyme M methyltransferase